MKAFLVVKSIDFPKTHDIERLVSMLPENIWLKLSVEEQRRFTDYATITRYPGDYEPIQLPEAKRSLALARRVRKEIRNLLSKDVLTQKKQE